MNFTGTFCTPPPLGPTAAEAGGRPALPQAPLRDAIAPPLHVLDVLDVIAVLAASIYALFLMYIHMNIAYFYLYTYQVYICVYNMCSFISYITDYTYTRI